jgi:peptidoglycan/xylan/chitin deacetylase (PgdA/CDA1 family)
MQMSAEPPTEVNFVSVTANGSATTTTTELTITLSAAIPGLAASSFDLMGATRGALSGTGPVYTLAITPTVAHGENVTVYLSKAGYTFTPAGRQVAVNVETISVTGVTLNRDTAGMFVGNSITLTKTVAPANATNKNVTWRSSDETVATVSETGAVTAVSEGTATITVTTADGGFTADCVVKVEARPPQQYYIAITFDDGPAITAGQGITPGVLDFFRDLNARDDVVCGMNDLIACAPGIGCGTVCGTISRAHTSFYINGNNISRSSGGVTGTALLRRMLQEGHTIENHTWNHPNLETGRVGGLPLTREHIRDDQLIRTSNAIRDAVNGTTCFYGITYNDTTNPYIPFSFRGTQFSMSENARFLDRELNMPWFAADIDPWDWGSIGPQSGPHSAQAMADYILYGIQSCNCVDNDNSSDSGTWCPIRTGANIKGVADGAANGSIILLHDGGGNRAPTLAMLSLVVPVMQEMGYHFVTVEQLLQYMDSEPLWHTATTPPNGSSGSGSFNVNAPAGQRNETWRNGAAVIGMPMVSGSPTHNSITVNSNRGICHKHIHNSADYRLASNNDFQRSCCEHPVFCLCSFRG